MHYKIGGKTELAYNDFKQSGIAKTVD
jgi:hypothetical protein